MADLSTVDFTAEALDKLSLEDLPKIHKQLKDELHTIKHQKRKRLNRIKRKNQKKLHLHCSQLKKETDTLHTIKLKKAVKRFESKASEDLRKGLKLAKVSAEISANNRTDRRKTLASDPSVHVCNQSQYYLDKASNEASIAERSKETLRRHQTLDTTLRVLRKGYTIINKILPNISFRGVNGFLTKHVFLYNICLIYWPCSHNLNSGTTLLMASTRENFLLCK